MSVTIYYSGLDDVKENFKQINERLLGKGFPEMTVKFGEPYIGTDKTGASSTFVDVEYDNQNKSILSYVYCSLM